MTRPPVEAMNSEQLTVEVRATYPYLVQLPEGYDVEPARRWPVVFFLHGKGERGRDLALLKRHGLPRLIAEGRRFPFVVIAPQCPEEEYWSEAPCLPAFVAAASARYRIDPARVYLTGISMGGFGVWALAAREPARYAALLPICGGGDVRWAAQLRDVPAWAFHGAQDTVVPPIRSEQMVAAIRAAGGTPRFTLYPDAGHDAWTETYANDAIYAWLLAQRRAVL